MKNLTKILVYLGLKNPTNVVDNGGNTWGHQMYERQFRTFKKDHQLDINNKSYKKGFIENFTSKYINASSLKNRLNK